MADELSSSSSSSSASSSPLSGQQRGKRTKRVATLVTGIETPKASANDDDIYGINSIGPHLTKHARRTDSLAKNVWFRVLQHPRVYHGMATQWLSGRQPTVDTVSGLRELLLTASTWYAAEASGQTVGESTRALAIQVLSHLMREEKTETPPPLPVEERVRVLLRAVRYQNSVLRVTHQRVNDDEIHSCDRTCLGTDTCLWVCADHQYNTILSFSGYHPCSDPLVNTGMMFPRIAGKIQRDPVPDVAFTVCTTMARVSAFNPSSVSQRFPFSLFTPGPSLSRRGLEGGFFTSLVPVPFSRAKIKDCALIWTCFDVPENEPKAVQYGRRLFASALVDLFSRVLVICLQDIETLPNDLQDVRRWQDSKTFATDALASSVNSAVALFRQHAVVSLLSTAACCAISAIDTLVTVERGTTDWYQDNTSEENAQRPYLLPQEWFSSTNAHRVLSSTYQLSTPRLLYTAHIGEHFVVDGECDQRQLLVTPMRFTIGFASGMAANCLYRAPEQTIEHHEVPSVELVVDEAMWHSLTPLLVSARQAVAAILLKPDRVSE
jgi:hypothetical protein